MSKAVASSESPKLVVMTGTKKTAYHRTRDCQHVPEGTAQEKPESYIEWHDLEPCPCCH